MRERRISVDGLQLHTLEDGAPGDRPPVLLLHGWPTHAGLWRHALPAIGGPVVNEGPTGPELEVVIWPSVNGRFIERALLEGEHEWRRWVLSNLDVDRLLALIPHWDLARRDLLVSLDGVVPCRDTLRDSRIWPAHQTLAV